MKLVYAAAAAAMVSAAPASATIILKESGVFDAGGPVLRGVYPDLGFGRYKVHLVFDKVPELRYGGVTQWFYDFNTCVLGNPDNVVCGGNYGTGVEHEMDVISPTELGAFFTVFDRRVRQRSFGSFLQSITFEAARANEQVGYTITVTRLGDAPVPEPATWAMMIGGFGLIGIAARRRARVKVAFG